MLRPAWLALTLIAAAPVAAANSEPPAGETPAEKPKEKKICRTEQVTGSLTRKRRTCATAEEWQELEASTYKSLTDQQRKAAGGYVPRG